MFKNIRAILVNLVDDIKKIWFVFSIIFYSTFIVFHAYSLLNNLNNLFFLIAYSVLFLISVFSLVFFLLKHKKELKKIKKFNNLLKVITASGIFIVNIVEFIRFGLDDFSKIMLIVSGIVVAMQILIELIKWFVEKYYKLFIIALNKDTELFHFESWKSNTLKIIDAPLEKLAAIKTGEEKELTKDQQY